MASLFFYKDIVALNREDHGDLRLGNADGKVEFAAETNLMPLAGTEFGQAARDYPIVFAGEEDELGPVAILGLRQGQNLFVESAGNWLPGHYVPAFVRRYPFILAETGEDGDFTVCIDRSWEGFGAEEGDLLFEEGEESKRLKEIIDFLRMFHAEMLRTRTFTKKLKELELLVRKDIQLTDAQGNAFAIRDAQVVDEERLAKLEDEQVLALHKEGFLGWIYAHLISLGNTTRLLTRAETLKQTKAA
ncbi:MAG: SapC family protein [Pseudomonadota bacterium]